MASNMCVRINSAMDENSKMKILANDLTRRLLNTSESIEMDERIKIIDDYSQKLVNSGYGIDQVRRIVLNGIKGYERKLMESRESGGRKIHRTAGESSGMRSRKKLLGKSEWFKVKKSTHKQEDSVPVSKQTPSYPGKWKSTRKLLKGEGYYQQKVLKTRTVLFVEQTRGGKLAKDIREVLSRLEGLLGFRVKVVERSGTGLKNILPNTNPWSGEHCSRSECITCNQGAEEKPDCAKRNLIYENICTICNPEALKKGELKTINAEVPSIYVGETARSVQERAKEHWDSYRSKEQDSHIMKHWVMHHNSEGEPKFIMKVVQFCRSALSRQVGEAVRIKNRGMVLNSKSEYNRCSISRLSLDQEHEYEGKHDGKEVKGEEDATIDWTAKMLERRNKVDRAERTGLGIAVTTNSVKRKDQTRGKGGTKRNKRKRYENLGEDWGVTVEEGVNTFLYSGLEGVRRHPQKGTVDDTAKRTSKVGKNKKALVITAKSSKKITDWIQPVQWYSSTPPPDKEECELNMNMNVEMCVVDTVLPGSVNGPSPDGPAGILCVVGASIGQAECSWIHPAQLAIQWESSTPPVDKEECKLTVNVEECAFNSEAVLPGSVNGPSPDGPAGTLCGNGVGAKTNTVRNIENGDRKKNKKVWTKLNNGLFAWRVRKTGKKTKGKLFKNSLGEQAPQSAHTKTKWEPGVLGEEIFKTGNYSTKRKLNFRGVTAKCGKESESMLGNRDTDLESDYCDEGAKKLKK